MAKRFIDKDKLIEHLEDDLRECGNPDLATEPITYVCSIVLKCALKYARTLPTADVAEVRHGKWTLHTDGSGTCSECGTTQKNVWDCDSWQNYCGHCGARMDGDAE